jgi:hypothetical protein
MYKLNYCIPVTANGESDDCFIDEYGHSKNFETIQELNTWVANNNVQIEDIDQI